MEKPSYHEKTVILEFIKHLDSLGLAVCTYHNAVDWLPVSRSVIMDAIESLEVAE